MRSSTETSGDPRRTSDSDATVDPLLATQLVPLPTIDAMAPEARLALALLEDAVMTLQATVGVDTPRARTVAAETWAWIASGETRHPFTFVCVCEHLDLDAACLRAGIRRWCRRQTTRAGSVAHRPRDRRAVDAPEHAAEDARREMQSPSPIARADCPRRSRQHCAGRSEDSMIARL